MVTTHTLGLPRIGARRELKTALERYWSAQSDAQALVDTADALCRQRIEMQRDAGLTLACAGDFALYDHVLDTAVLLDALPRRFERDARTLTLPDIFALARGTAHQPAMEMTKWFDTNYHYVVPELDERMQFNAGGVAWFEQIAAAQRLDASIKPVLLGPVTFLWLSKCAGAPFDRLALVPALADAYARILARLHAMGIAWVQLDEPALCLDLDPAWRTAFDAFYARPSGPRPRVLLATYFDAIDCSPAQLASWAIDGVHLDAVRAPGQLDAWVDGLPAAWVLSVGIVDGRNVWRSDLRRALERLKPWHDRLGDRLWLAPSCSLLHVPVSLGLERHLDAELASWLAFANEKLHEVRTLARALDDGEASVRDALDASSAAAAARAASPRTRATAPQLDPSALAALAQRAHPYAVRRNAQRATLELPLLPTTTIGSFPQTPALREARARFKSGASNALTYLQHVRDDIRHAIGTQERLGLDVLVHGEAERNDMVEYFGERLRGFAVTSHAWVQSYGSRCVKPPILYGDVSRREALTVDTTVYAQSLTDKPVKGMLTGPVTMLQWSFVRDDQPREATLLQLALAIRDEVAELQSAGVRIIQIDEPAFREGLPLKRSAWGAWLDRAVQAFRIAAGVARDDTQIHTHMCYSEFNDVLSSIAALDADVITIETARSRMELLEAFGSFAYPNEIGPGVYDIHAPRVPTVDEMVALLERACAVVPPERLWVNPDCGLKTRHWPETEAALANMLEAARRMRARLAEPADATPIPSHEESAR